MKPIISCLILLLAHYTFAQSKPGNAATVPTTTGGANVIIKESPIDSTVIKAVSLPTISTGNPAEIFDDDTGCTKKYAISQSEFSGMIRTINLFQSDDDRLLEAFRHVRKNCLNSAQIAQICKSFTSEKTRLEFAKFAYSTCVDPKNYAKVSAVLAKKSNLDDLQRYITGK